MKHLTKTCERFRKLFRNTGLVEIVPRVGIQNTEVPAHKICPIHRYNKNKCDFFLRRENTLSQMNGKPLISILLKQND